MGRTLKVLLWGTYDTGKPRIRILRKGLREAGVEVDELHFHVWRGIEDKSQVSSVWAAFRLIGTAAIWYPILLFRYIFSARHDFVVCGYFAYLDALLIWPLAKLRREKVVVDAFLPIFNTVVEDRKLYKLGSLPSRLIQWLERISLRSADVVLVDTDAHGRYYADKFLVDPRKIVRAFVGVESENFSPKGAVDSGPVATVLFYGQFIPLHGIETIVEAARLLSDTAINFRIVGTGQEASKIRDMIAERNPGNLDWTEWVEYKKLQIEIEKATVCLGIFGTSDKSGRVIPNKVFQIVSAGKPLITRDSPAIRELFGDNPPKGVTLIEPGKPQALAQAIVRAIGATDTGYSDRIIAEIAPSKIGQRLRDDLLQRMGV
jgi:glycosyltransferase involved in cell wall biosynthesis